LDLTGPVVVEGVEYNQYNFIDLLQYRVEKGYEQLGVPSWERKEVIGDILSVIKKRVLDLSLAQLMDAMAMIADGLDRKDVIVHFRDPELSAVVNEQGWDGAVNDTAGDYIYAVDANMAALKTDAVIGRQLTYALKQDWDKTTALLTARYSHNGEFNWKTTRYRSYTRFYVPLGSRLIKAEGIDEEKIEIHNELGKTVFSVFFEVEPGEIGSLSLEYALPENIHKQIEAGRYSLYIQKQPGKAVQSLVADLNFYRPITAYSPTGFSGRKTEAGRFHWEGDLQLDREFNIFFQSR
jgi:hypothetical protein